MNRMVRLNAIKQDIQASKQDIDLAKTVEKKQISTLMVCLIDI